jgi:glycosyltransferase involved in cell wall biosynthesis
MPVRWREPFGMVMVEALACGTPVIAFPEGAAAEIVIDGENGLLVPDEAGMVQAIDRVGRIDAARCRASVAERYDVSVSVAGYERVYRQAIDGRRLPRISRPRRTVPEMRRVRAEPTNTSR